MRGTKLGSYEVLEAIGQGGAGAVYRARAGAGSPDVAIKLIHRKNPEALARFEREVRLQAAFGEAEGFVPLLDSGSSPKGPYLVMPLLTGGTLRARLERGRFAIDDAIALVSALALALGRAHERGIVHRDMKPENVLFSMGGIPLVADLGLAKHFSGESPGASQSVQLSQTGTLRGTAGYMSPEQMGDSKEAGPPADVFALGAILYECLAGAPAFEGASIIELVTKVDAGAFVPLAKVRPEVPAWLAAVVVRALAHEPRARFEDGAAFARALAAGKPAARGRRSLALTAVGLLALAATGVVGLALSRRASPKVEPAVADTPAPRGPPDLMRGFREGPGWKLLGTWGSYDWKHGEWVVGDDLSRDGKRVLSVSLDGRTKVWDLATGHELACLVEEPHENCCAFSPDGKEAVLGRSDGVVKIWNPETGASRELERHGSEITTVAWSPDGKTILAAGGTVEPPNLKIRHLDAATGRIIRELDPRIGHNTSVSFLPDGKRAFSSGNAGVMVLWDVESGAELVRTQEVDHRISGAAVSADGRVAISADCEAATATLWNLAAGTSVRTVARNEWEEILSVALTPDGKRALVGGRKGLELWDLAVPGAPLWRKTLDWAVAVHFTADGKRAIAGLHDHTVRVWDCDSGRELGERAGLDGDVLALGTGPRGAVAVTKTADTVEIREARAGGAARTLPVGYFARSVALSSDGSLALTGREGSGNERSLWNLETGEKLWSQSAPKPATCLALSRDRKFGLTTDDTGLVCRFPLSTGASDAASGDVVQSEDHLNGLAFLGGGDRWLGTGKTGTVSVMSVNDNGLDQRHPRLGHQDGVPSALATSSDGLHALTGDIHGGVKLWTISRKSSVDVAAGTAAITALAFSPDDRLTVAADHGGRVSIFGERAALVGTIDLATSMDWATALAFEGPKVLLVGTARGVVHRFQILAK